MRMYEPFLSLTLSISKNSYNTSPTRLQPTLPGLVTRRDAHCCLFNDKLRCGVVIIVICKCI